MGLVSLNIKGCSSNQIYQLMEEFIERGAKDPKGLQTLAANVSKYITEQSLSVMGENASTKREIIATLVDVKAAMLALRDEMHKCCLAKTTLQEVVRSSVDKTFGIASAEAKARLKKYEEVETLLASNIQPESDNPELAGLKAGEIAKCIQQIDVLKDALEKSRWGY